jgi:hypothetical protein
MRKLATYEGVVENGHVTLPPNADIPEKTRVYVLVPDAESQRTPRIASPRLVHPEQAKDFEMQVIEDTTDDGV